MLSRRLLLLTIMCLVLAASVGPTPAQAQRVPAGGAPPAGGGGRTISGFIRVIDGDTIEAIVDGQRTGIGLSGLNAPIGKTDCGREAATLLRALVRGGLRLEEDAEETFDARGRRMYHAYTRDGRLVGEELVRAGVVRANGRGKEKARIAAAAASARAERRGCAARQAELPNEGDELLAKLDQDAAAGPSTAQASAASAPPPALRAAPAATALPSGFTQDVIVSGLVQPTTFAFTPDGRIFVAEKGGRVRVYKNGALLPTPLIDINDRVNDYWDHGLIGMAIDPSFATNGYIYLLYTYENNGEGGGYFEPKTGRLARYTVVGDTASPATETVILGTQVGASCNNFPMGTDCIPSESPSHSVGGLEFAPDGTLRVSLGDGAQFNFVDDNALRAQNLDSLAGKVLRIHTTGQGVSNNPFWNGDPNANRSKVWAYGLRNPYRLNLRPNSSTVYLGDVGWSTWEEVNTAPAGANLGWPCFEGAARQAGYEPKSVCQSLYNQGASAVRNPLVAYHHNGGSAAVTGGTFYTGTAYPAEYQGAYFYSDFSQGFIRSLRVDGEDGLTPGSDAEFATAADGPVAMEIGLDGNIYYMAINVGELRRIRYTAGNTPPTANASASPTSGLAPLTVQFSSAGSADPNADPLTYSWNFGDGSPPSTQPNPQHVYTTNGNYTATLTVDDGHGGIASDTVAIAVGNSPPAVTIDSPSASYQFKVGDLVTYSGAATDPEDGALAGANLSWQIILHHCPGGACHAHQFTTATGATGSFTAPDHGDESHFELILTATDSGGLTSTTSVLLQPQTVQLSLNTVPPGLQVVYDGIIGPAPLTRETIVGSTHTINTPTEQGNVTFASWSDGGAAQHNVVAGSTSTTYTANFDVTCPCTFWDSSATPAVAAQEDGGAVELGVAFQADVAGYITGIRFYKGPGNTGTHVGNLWSAAGANLATATFTGETASGWQEVTFSTPVQIAANTTYVASYHAPAGHYSLNPGYFNATAVANPPLRAVIDGANPQNGRYKYGPSSFPDQTYNASNYWVDVVFTTTPPPPDTTPPVISAVQADPVTSFGATITWTTNEVADSQVEYGTSTSYGSSTTLDPTRVTAHSVQLSGLAASTTYHYRVKSRDAAGNLTTSGDLTFTTAAGGGPSTCPCTIWPDTATPGIASDPDTSPFELGVKFRTDVDGYITGIRFYKGPGNTGTHVGNLWSAGGANLATATFTGETASGWQTVTFGTPVQVTANTTYVASYHAPNGGFAKNEAFFIVNGVDRGPLHALASPASNGNGVFKSGASGFPNQTYNDSNYWVDVVFTTTPPPPDTTPPVISAIQAGSVTNSGATITWTTNEAADSQVEYGTSTSYGSSTTLDPTRVTAHSVQLSGLAASTTYHYRVKSRDAAGNLTTSGDLTFTTAAAPAPPTCPCTIWPDAATPANPADTDPSPFELGVKFRVDVGGYVTGVRFYKGSGNTGTHVGNLWSAAGANLATATFTGETASGWQTVTFGTPVQVTTNTTYVASYHAPNGHFARDAGAFNTAGVDRGPLHALASPASGGNGVFRAGPSGFPSNSYQDSNYWVDVVFTTTPPPPDTTPPVISAVQAGSVTNSGATITWTTDEAADSQVEYGTSTSYGSSTTLDPTRVTAHSVQVSGLAASTTYHYRVKSRDGAGNLTTSGDLTFTTAAGGGPSTCPCTIWPDTATPGIASDPDTSPFELGVKFRTDVDGYITGVRFYKGPNNTGTHVGNLWSAAGANLATATFTGETASGWQTVTFGTPVQVTANTTYVASYHAPNGGFAKNEAFFIVNGVDRGPLHALASPASNGNGVFKSGASGFPNQTYNDSNYWVDVVFTTTPPPPDTTPPVISAVQAGSVTNSGATITWTTNEAADSQVEYGTSTSYGSSTTLDPTRVTAHSVQLSGLAASTTYHYRVKSRDAAGNLTTSGDLTFTTAAAPAPPTCPCTIWPTSASPALASESDTQAVELGVKFRSDVDGYITGIRFYKGPGNTGTHVGSLWSSTGTRLATATFSNETATGWQTVTFATPVQVTANTTYVASYHAPNGGYAKNENGLAAAVDRAPLHALASATSGGNGLYSYGPSSFPTNTYNATNYWVDVVFTTSASP